MLEWIIGALIALLSVVVSIAGYQFAKIKEIKEQSKQEGIIVTKIENLKESVDIANQSLKERIICIEDRAEIRAVSCKEHGEKLVKTESKADSAHKRLDGHEERINRLEGAR